MAGLIETKNVALQFSPLLGDPHPLLEQLGKSELAPALPWWRRASSAADLRAFLAGYRNELLIRLELPAIVRAHRHACTGEFRELLALDDALATDPTMRPFAQASCRTGQRQMSKLRPLRDHRLVQRYLAAIQGGQARGWHMLVYGVAMSVYSLPLRQGLSAYAAQTLAGFIGSAGERLRLPQTDARQLFDEAHEPVPAAIDTLLRPAAQPKLLE